MVSPQVASGLDEEPSALADKATLQSSSEPFTEIGSAGPFTFSTAMRTGLALLSLLLCLSGGVLVEISRGSEPETPPLFAWVLFAAAGVLLAAASYRVVRLMIAPPVPFMASVAKMPDPQRSLFNVLRLMSVVSGVGAMALFMVLSESFEDPSIADNWLVNNGSWLLYITSLALFGASFVIWERNAPPPSGSSAQYDVAGASLNALRARTEWVLVAIVTLIALLIRVLNLDNAPPGLWFDEAQNGYVGRQLLAAGAVHTPFISAYTQMGALYFYLVGIIDKFMGAGPWQVRLLPALAGTLTVPLLYFIGSRLFGWRVGLASSAFLAVSAWNITFSRYGMASMFTVALDMGVYLLVLQGLRTGRLGYYAGAGVLLGLTFQAYYIGRLVPFVLVALLAHLYFSERVRIKQALRSGATVFFVGAVLAAIPVITFAVQHREIYNGRVDTVSVLSAYGSDGRTDALETNVMSHLLMFNWLGDNNGRHNLPGAPMLDWIVASLFWSGLCLCVLRVRRWQYFFPVAWFLCSLVGGVFSVVWEAPHAHRTLENSVVTALLAGIFIGAVVEQVGRFSPRGLAARRPVTRNLLPVAGMALLAVLVLSAAALDLPRYFVAQASNRWVWVQMQVPELRAAQLAQEYSVTRAVYLDREYMGEAMQPYRYLNLDASAVQKFDGLYMLPITRTRDVALALDPSNSKDPNLLRSLYPHAVLEPLQASSDPAPIMYTALIPASDIRDLYGARYALSVTGEDGGALSMSNKLDGTSIEWPVHASIQLPGAIPFNTLEFSTTLKVEGFGSYLFTWTPASDSTLVVDGAPVGQGQPIALSTGLHTLLFTGVRPAGERPVTTLMWLAPGDAAPHTIPPANLLDPQRVAPRGLTGVYRPGSGFDAAPTLARVDPDVSFNTASLPITVPYTVEWRGYLYAPSSGNYSIGPRQIGHSTLSVDGKQILDNTTGSKQTGSKETQFMLTEGWHEVSLRFNPGAEIFRIYLEWTPPGGVSTVIPSAYLWPVTGSHPDRPPALLISGAGK